MNHDKAEFENLLSNHVFDDGTGSEITPFRWLGCEIVARAYHPRYGWLVCGYDNNGDWFSNQTYEDLCR